MEHIAAIKAEIDAEDNQALSDDLLREKFRIQKWVSETVPRCITTDLHERYAYHLALFKDLVGKIFEKQINVFKYRDYNVYSFSDAIYSYSDTYYALPKPTVPAPSYETRHCVPEQFKQKPDIKKTICSFLLIKPQARRVLKPIYMADEQCMPIQIGVEEEIAGDALAEDVKKELTTIFKKFTKNAPIISLCIKALCTYQNLLGIDALKHGCSRYIICSEKEFEQYVQDLTKSFNALSSWEVLHSAIALPEGVAYCY